jgi:hypothetical protein
MPHCHDKDQNQNQNQNQDTQTQIKALLCTILSLVQTILSLVSNLPQSVVRAVATFPGGTAIVEGIVSTAIATTSTPAYYTTTAISIDGTTCNNQNAIINTHSAMSAAMLNLNNGNTATFALATNPTVIFSVTMCNTCSSSPCPCFFASPISGPAFTVPAGSYLFLRSITPPACTG